MSRDDREIVSLARRYCELIEASGAERGLWLREVADLLPRLDAAMGSLNGRPYDAGATLTPDLDARFELYGHLYELLGDRDGYWLEFDRSGDTETMTGSLADDLTDIYCELKHGLRVADEQLDRALQCWMDGFEYHWRQHLADAQRHLSTLALQGRLD